MWLVQKFLCSVQYIRRCLKPDLLIGDWLIIWLQWWQVYKKSTTAHWEVEIIVEVYLHYCLIFGTRWSRVMVTFTPHPLCSGWRTVVLHCKGDLLAPDSVRRYRKRNILYPVRNWTAVFVKCYGRSSHLFRRAIVLGVLRHTSSQLNSASCCIHGGEGVVISSNSSSHISVVLIFRRVSIVRCQSHRPTDPRAVEQMAVLISEPFTF